jgi:hypothetical protein
MIKYIVNGRFATSYFFFALCCKIISDGHGLNTVLYNTEGEKIAAENVRRLLTPRMRHQGAQRGDKKGAEQKLFLSFCSLSNH